MFFLILVVTSDHLVELNSSFEFTFSFEIIFLTLVIMIIAKEHRL